MPRKRTTILDGFSNPFPTRLRTLLTETKTTQQRLADAIGMKNRQSIGNYCDARAMPDLETFAKIADFFKVSPAWLLGMTDDPAIFPAATDELGLSPDAVSYLRGLTILRRDSNVSEAEKRYFPISVLSAMLESRDFESVLSWCAEYIRLVNTPCSLLYSTTEEYKKLSAVLGQHGYVVTAPDRLAMCLFSERITNTLEKLLEDISKKVAETDPSHVTDILHEELADSSKSEAD